MGALLLWWLVLEGLGLAALPLVFPLFARGSGHGYPFAKIVALLLLTYVSWMAGYVIPFGAALNATLLLLVAGGIVAGIRQREQISQWLKEGGWQAILRADLLWTIGFLFFAWQRSVNPEIFQQEKYMDFAFFNLLIREQHMPPGDPWMAGLNLNYYYFGYLMFAGLARIVPLGANVSYNLCVATIAGLGFAQAAAVVLQVTRRWGLALLGGAMFNVLGNLDGFLQLLENGSLRNMNFWRSSRILDGDNTINEFPFFSSIHGDLHPHFMVLPLSLLFLGVLLDERLFPSRAAAQPGGWRRRVSYLIAAFVLGAMVAVSTWELPMGALVFVLLAGRHLPLLPLITRERLQFAAVAAGVVVLARYGFFLPATLGVNLTPGGVGFKFATTSLGEFLTINGGLLLMPAALVLARGVTLLPGGAQVRDLALAAAAFVLAACTIGGNAVFPLLLILGAGAVAVAYFDVEEDERGALLLAAAAMFALWICEFFYIKDAYGERLYRMNTVFKFYMQAWTLLAVAAPWCFGLLLERSRSWPPAARALRGAMGAVVAAAACYPLGISLDRMGHSPTLDGNRYLEQPHFRDDYAVIRWIRDNVDGLPVLLEATGDPYSYFARFSSNTGLPTVMGWANHEGLWRAHEPRVAQRVQEVHRMYSAGSLGEAQPLLDQYGVRYVVVGEMERRKYPAAGLAKFEALEVAYRSGGTVLYRR